MLPRCNITRDVSVWPAPNTGQPTGVVTALDVPGNVVFTYPLLVGCAFAKARPLCRRYNYADAVRTLHLGIYLLNAGRAEPS